MEPDAFRHTLRVRYHETDQQGIVYHARYLEYLDVAMTEFLRHLGWGYERLVSEGCDPSIVKTTLEFARPAVFDDDLAVEVWTTAVGSSSFTLGFEVFRSGDPDALLKAQTVYVNFDSASRRSRLLPVEVRDCLRTLLRTGDPGGT